MLQSIFNVIKSIGDFFVTMFSWVSSGVKQLVGLVLLLGKAVLAIPSYISWIPFSVVAVITVMITVAVLYKVLGREG